MAGAAELDGRSWVPDVAILVGLPTTDKDPGKFLWQAAGTGVGPTQECAGDSGCLRGLVLSLSGPGGGRR